MQLLKTSHYINLSLLYINIQKVQVVKVLKELTNDEWVIILAKRTGSDSSDHVSLNPRKVAEIKQFLQKMD
jgi:hypothetical protein